MNFFDRAPNDDPPVTVDVMQRVKPGCETAFEAVLAELIAVASSFEGHLGVTVFRPSDRANPDYRVVFKFDHVSNLKRWETSAIRQTLVERARQLTVDSGRFSILTGLETWFTLPSQPGMSAPPRYKMVAISGLTIYVLSNIINPLLLPILHPLPLLLRTFVITFLMVMLMTYVVMPRVTNLFAGWLYPKPKH